VDVRVQRWVWSRVRAHVWTLRGPNLLIVQWSRENLGDEWWCGIVWAVINA
jgi:hypothetical protein